LRSESGGGKQIVNERVLAGGSPGKGCSILQIICPNPLISGVRILNERGPVLIAKKIRSKKSCCSGIESDKKKKKGKCRPDRETKKDRTSSPKGVDRRIVHHQHCTTPIQVGNPKRYRAGIKGEDSDLSSIRHLKEKDFNRLPRGRV